MRLSTLFLRLAVITAVAGVLLGFGMGMTKSFSLSTVHAHINLLGWVSMFLYGLFYRVEPEAERLKLSRYHFSASVAGVALFIPSLTIELAGPSTLSGLAAAGLGLGSALIVAGMILFAAVVFRATRQERR